MKFTSFIAILAIVSLAHCGGKDVLKTVAKKCMDGNNVPAKAQGIVNGAIDALPNFRRDRRLGVLAKAACDTAVTSACGAAGVPPVVCKCFKKDLSAKCQSYISRRDLSQQSRRLGGKDVLKTVAKKCMDGNNVPAKGQSIVNGAIDALPNFRRDRRLGVLAKAACDTAVTSACGAAGVPPVVCKCFKKDLSAKCQSYISRRDLGQQNRRLGGKDVLKTVAKKCMDGNNVPSKAQGIVNGAIDALPNFRRERRMGVLAKAACDTAVTSACGAAGVPPVVCKCFKKDLSAKCQSYISRRRMLQRRLGGKDVLKTVAKKCMDGNNVPSKAQGIVNGAIDALPNFRRDRRLGVLAKAACDTAVTSACGAAGVPPVVCKCFKKDLSAKCQSYIS